MRDILYRWLTAYLGAIGFILYGGGGKSQAPAAPPPPEPPQAAKQPQRDPMVAINRQNAAVQGPGSTMLTGGVDSNTLSLGKTSLYDKEKEKLGA